MEINKENNSFPTFNTWREAVRFCFDKKLWGSVRVIQVEEGVYRAEWKQQN